MKKTILNVFLITLPVFGLTAQSITNNPVNNKMVTEVNSSYAVYVKFRENSKNIPLT